VALVVMSNVSTHQVREHHVHKMVILAAIEEVNDMRVVGVLHLVVLTLNSEVLQCSNLRHRIIMADTLIGIVVGGSFDDYWWTAAHQATRRGELLGIITFIIVVGDRRGKKEGDTCLG